MKHSEVTVPSRDDRERLAGKTATQRASLDVAGRFPVAMRSITNG